MSSGVTKSGSNNELDVRNKEKCQSNEPTNKVYYQKTGVDDFNVINTVPWKVHIDKNFDWVLNMTHHMRYKDQEMKYKQKDTKMLGLGWKSICNTSAGNNKEKYSVIPLDETSKGIQKKFRNVVRAHIFDWKVQDSQCDVSVNIINTSKELDMCNKLSRSIAKLLPKVNEKLVLDIQRSKQNIVITAKQHEDEQKLKGQVHEILVQTMLRSINIKYMDYNSPTFNHENGLIEDCNQLLCLYPRRLEEECGRIQDFILPHNTIGIYIAKALYLNKSSLAVICGCAAGLRLWSNENTNHDSLQNMASLHFPLVVPLILYQTVEAKSKERTHRSLFSINKLKRLENELGIGMYSMNNFKCAGCGVADACGYGKYKYGIVNHNNVKLNKCNGCSRVWYCGQPCQERNWSQHKHVCGNRWRKKTVYLKSQLTYNIMKKMIVEKTVVGGVSSRVQVDILTGDVFVFCLDPDTDQIFDGLTDRPVSFLSSLEQQRKEPVSNKTKTD